MTTSSDGPSERTSPDQLAAVVHDSVAGHIAVNVFVVVAAYVTDASAVAVNFGRVHARDALDIHVRKVTRLRPYVMNVNVCPAEGVNATDRRLRSPPSDASPVTTIRS